MIPGTHTKKLAVFLIVLSGFYSCGVRKFIPPEEVLYTGSDLKTVSESRIRNFSNLKKELDLVLKPEPNSKFLGMRPGLYFHYKAQRKKPGFINKWLNKKFGEDPVYLSDVDPDRIKELLLNRLENHGFFYSKVTSALDSTAKYAHIRYSAELPEPYVLEKFRLDSDSLPIYKDIEETLPQRAITKGDRFDLNLIKFERTRIDNELKQKGYYNFNPDFLIFEADTNQYDNKRFDLFLRLKKEVPPKALIPYLIDSITVFSNYSIATDSIVQDKTTYKDLTIVQDEEFFKPKRLEPYILFEKGQQYNAETAKLTSNRLASIGSYKYVNIRFTEKDTTAGPGESGSLDADIYLSPLTKRAIRAELEAVTKSNGFAGPGIGLTYNNRNLFHGGETLSLRGNFAYETQLASGNNTGLSSIGGGVRAELSIPRLVPFPTGIFRYAVPKTRIGLGWDFLNRSKLYTLNSINTSFGYTWNANRYVYHELNPITVNYLNLSSTTPEFETILDKNPFLRRSFEQEFIAGLTYSFTYNELGDENIDRPFFLSTSLDIAGNALSLFSGGKKEVFGLEYAQYFKADMDFRYYLKWGQEQVLVSRIYGGWGIPYGNSNTLPFVKQFFAGGPYSVRAFKIRSLGPGVFTSEQEGSTFFDQSGNLRLEANLEYRFPVWSYLNGAVFADAGNVWLTYDPQLPADTSAEGQDLNRRLQEEGRFGKDWVKELGIGVGFGLRVDIRSFVIRFDLASPLQIPYLPEGERLRVPFLDGGSNNLVFNFAIGYPF